jgi:hypothetical protein
LRRGAAFTLAFFAASFAARAPAWRRLASAAPAAWPTMGAAELGCVCLESSIVPAVTPEGWRVTLGKVLLLVVETES